MQGLGVSGAYGTLYVLSWVGMARKNRDGSEYTVYFCPKHKNKESAVKEIITENVDRIVSKVIAKDLISRGDLTYICKALSFINYNNIL